MYCNVCFYWVCGHEYESSINNNKSIELIYCEKIGIYYLIGTVIVINYLWKFIVLIKWIVLINFVDKYSAEMEFFTLYTTKNDLTILLSGMLSTYPLMHHSMLRIEALKSLIVSLHTYEFSNMRLSDCYRAIHHTQFPIMYCIYLYAIKMLILSPWILFTSPYCSVLLIYRTETKTTSFCTIPDSGASKVSR